MRNRLLFFSIIVTVMLLLVVGNVQHALVVNISIAKYAHLLLKNPSEIVEGTYPLVAVELDDSSSARVPRLVKADTMPVRWAVLRLALAHRDYALAAEVAETLQDFYLDYHPLAKYDALLARSIMTPESVQPQLPRLDERNGQIPPRVADSIAVGILDALSDSDVDNALSPTDLQRLKAVKLLRPNDLYTDYRLWVDSLSQKESVVQHSPVTGLQHFTREALLPNQPELVKFVYLVVPKLYDSGLWTPEQTTIAIDTVLRLCVKAPEASSMLKTLATTEFPDSMLAQLSAQLEQCRVKRSAAQTDSVSGSNATSKGEEDQRSHLNQLGLGSAILGPNLINNGDFSALALPGLAPIWWLWACPQFSTGTEGLFLGGSNEVEPGSVEPGAHIVGLWRDDQKPGVCGFYRSSEEGMGIEPLTLDPQATYLLTFDYRTDWLDDGEAGVYFGGPQDVFYNGGLSLAQTQGCWHRIYVLGQNPTANPAQKDLLLYSGGSAGGIGRVEFNNVTWQAISWQGNQPAMSYPVVRDMSLCGRHAS